jgi:hypothetical protein
MPPLVWELARLSLYRTGDFEKTPEAIDSCCRLGTFIVDKSPCFGWLLRFPKIRTLMHVATRNIISLKQISVAKLETVE